VGEDNGRWGCSSGGVVSWEEEGEMCSVWTGKTSFWKEEIPVSLVSVETPLSFH